MYLCYLIGRLKYQTNSLKKIRIKKTKIRERQRERKREREREKNALSHEDSDNKKTGLDNSVCRVNDLSFVFVRNGQYIEL